MDVFRFMDRDQSGDGPTGEELKQLKAPFPAGAIEWVITARSNDKTRGLVAPFCNWTVYAHQLDTLFGADWNFEVQYLTPKMTVMLVHLTIRGKTRTQIIAKDENAHYDMWSAGFRRACAMWGLGGYLYHAIPKVWVKLKNEKYIDDGETAKLLRIAEQFTTDWANALENDLMDLVAVSADPTPDFDEAPAPLPTPEPPRPVPAPRPKAPEAPQPEARPAPRSPAPAPVREQSVEELAGIVINYPKAMALTGKESPTIYDVWNADGGREYLEWIATKSKNADLATTVKAWITKVPDNWTPDWPTDAEIESASAPEAPPAPAPTPDPDGVIGDVEITNMPDLRAKVNEFEQWDFENEYPLFTMCQEQLGWAGVPTTKEAFAEALAWFAGNSPE